MYQEALEKKACKRGNQKAIVVWPARGCEALIGNPVAFLVSRALKQLAVA